MSVPTKNWGSCKPNCQFDRFLLVVDVGRAMEILPFNLYFSGQHLMLRAASRINDEVPKPAQTDSRGSIPQPHLIKPTPDD